MQETLKIIGVVVTLTVLVGCAVSVTSIMGPNGGEAYAMNCKGPVEKCYSKAGELCPSGYIVIDRASTAFSVTNSYNGATTGGSRNSLMIECKQ